MNMTAIIITAIICFTVMVVVTTICKMYVEKEEIYWTGHNLTKDSILINEIKKEIKEDDNARS